MSDAPEESDIPPEQIAFVPRDLLSEHGWLPHGFRADPDQRIYASMCASVDFSPRPSLETDESRKQLIPYVVLFSDEGIFTLRRRRAQSESRLHDKLSIGVGGHVQQAEQRTDLDVLRAGMRRELHEELHIPESVDVDYCGVLNDDSNDVGRVHYGVVFRCEADPSQVDVREVEKMVGEWWSVDELEAEKDRLESWSRLLLPAVKTGRV